MRPIDADALSEAINVSDEELAEFVVNSVKDSKKWDDAFERCKAVRDGMLLDIKDQPTLDYAPVVHAHWVKYTPFDIDYGLRYCSECLHFGEEKNKYCPNCGARMGGDTE